MSKRFRSGNVDQQWLLPPSVQDFVAEGHPAQFVGELVRGELDLGAILMKEEEERLRAQVREWFERAEAADAKEDEEYGWSMQFAMVPAKTQRKCQRTTSRS